MKCSPWQIWLGNFKFEETSETKRRPVLILDCERMIAIALKMTSHEPRPGDYALVDLAKAGLRKPTAVRFQMLELEEQDLLHQIGRLSLLDELNIRKMHK